MPLPRHGRAIVIFTIVLLIVYVPIETWYSAPELWDPFYVVDFIGMVLLTWGVVRVRRDGSPAGFAILAAGYGWEGANFWREFFGSIEALGRGETLELGNAELCFVACGTVAALFAMVWALRLATQPPAR